MSTGGADRNHATATGELYRKGTVRKWDWKLRHFELSNQELLCYSKQGDAEPKDRFVVGGVYDVPNRGGGARPHRFDVAPAPASAGGGTNHDAVPLLSLAAASEDEKRRWLNALAAAAQLLQPSEHRRHREFAGTVLATRGPGAAGGDAAVAPPGTGSEGDAGDGGGETQGGVQHGDARGGGGLDSGDGITADEPGTEAVGMLERRCRWIDLNEDAPFVCFSGDARCFAHAAPRKQLVVRSTRDFALVYEPISHAHLEGSWTQAGRPVLSQDGSRIAYCIGGALVLRRLLPLGSPDSGASSSEPYFKRENVAAFALSGDWTRLALLQKDSGRITLLEMRSAHAAAAASLAAVPLEASPLPLELLTREDGVTSGGALHLSTDGARLAYCISHAPLGDFWMRSQVKDQMRTVILAEEHGWREWRTFDGRKLVAISGECTHAIFVDPRNTFAVVNVETGDTVYAMSHAVKPNREPVWGSIAGARLSGDGRVAYTADWHFRHVISDTRTGAVLHSHHYGQRPDHWRGASRDGLMFAAKANDGEHKRRLLIRDFALGADGLAPKTFVTNKGAGSCSSSFAAPDESAMVVGKNEHTVCRLPPLNVFSDATVPQQGPRFKMRHITYHVPAALSAGGTHVCFWGGVSTQVAVFDARSGEELPCLELEATPKEVQASLDGRYFYVVMPGSVDTYGVPTSNAALRRVRSVPHDESWPCPSKRAAYDARYDALAYVSKENACVVIVIDLHPDSEASAPVQIMSDAPVQRVQFSSDGSVLAFGGTHGWALADSRSGAVLQRADNAVAPFPTTVSADGSVFACLDEDIVRVYEWTAEGAPLLTPASFVIQDKGTYCTAKFLPKTCAVVVVTNCSARIHDAKYGCDMAPAPADLAMLAERIPEAAAATLERFPEAVNICDSKGDTALHFATRSGSVAALRCLTEVHTTRKPLVGTSIVCDNLACHMVANKQGETPLTIAINRMFAGCADTLVPFIAARCTPVGRADVARLDLVRLMNTFPAIAERLFSSLALDPCAARVVYEAHDGQDDAPGQRLVGRACIPRLVIAGSASPMLAQHEWRVGAADVVVEPWSLWSLWTLCTGVRASDTVPVVVEPRVVGLAGLANNRAFLDAVCATRHPQLLETDAVRVTLEWQWRSRHFKAFFVQFVAFVILLVCFSLWLASVNSRRVKGKFGGSGEQRSATEIVCAAVTLFLAVMFALIECIQLAAPILCKWRLRGHNTAAASAPIDDTGSAWSMWLCTKAYLASGWNLVDASFLVLTLYIVTLWLVDGGSRVDPALSGAAGFLLYMKFLGFLRGFRPLGALVAVLAQVATDAAPFLLILAVMVGGFGFAFSGLDHAFGEGEDPSSTAGDSHHSLLMLSLGELFLDNVGEDTAIYPKLIHIFALLVMLVMMMNLLIAIISDSFERMQEKEAAQFLHERAQIIRDNNVLLDVLGIWPEQDCHWLHVLAPAEANVGDEGTPGDSAAKKGIRQHQKATARELTRLIRAQNRATDGNIAALGKQVREQARVLRDQADALRVLSATLDQWRKH